MFLTIRMLGEIILFRSIFADKTKDKEFNKIEKWSINIKVK